MIKSIKKLTLHDIDSDSEITVDIDSDGVKFNLYGYDSDFKISADELVSLAFFVAKPEFQDAFLKETQREVRQYRKQHVVKVKKSMKKGDEIIVNCEVNVPLLVENKLIEELTPKIKKELNI